MVDLRFWRHLSHPIPPVQTPVAPTKQTWNYDAANAVPPLAMRRSPFAPAIAGPGVIPPGVTIATDSAMPSQFDMAYASAGYASLGMADEGRGFMGYPYLAELLQLAEYRNACDMLSQDMTRKWIKLQCTGDSENKSDKLAAIEAEMKRLGVQQIVRAAAWQGDGFGRAQIYIDTGDGDDPDELLMPLVESPAKVGLGALRALRIIEPMWTYPNRYNTNDPLHPHFFKPETWFVLGKEIHASRIMTIVPRPVSDMLKPAYAFGGLALPQIMKPYVDNWIRTRQSVTNLVSNFSVMVLATDLSTFLTTNSGADLERRVQFFNVLRDNQGAMVVNRETESLSNISAPIAGLDRLQSQAQEHMASVCRIPLIKLLGISPSGLNASSDGEIRSYYDNIESMQEAIYTAHLSKIINLIQLSLFGEVDKEITFVWEPLWSLDAIESATARKTEAETDCILMDHGVLSTMEVRIRIAADENSPHAGLDLGDALATNEPEEYYEQ
jgi:hypothetical protein